MTETITATFVFTDLVGSTALGSRLGPVGAEEIRAIHFGLLRGAIDNNGGDEVKNLGDGLMVKFNSAGRALVCAVEMQQAFETHNRRADEPLKIRLGISVGEATEEDGDYFGDPVIEAARLCAKADGDQILASSTVGTLAGRRYADMVRPFGELELKGIPEPVATDEVIWEPEVVGAGALPMPGRALSALTNELFGFFGREREIAVLCDAANAVESARSAQFVAIAGEPGIGKTTMACRAAQRLNTQGTTVLFGRSEEGLAVPFRAWIEALTHLVEHVSDEILVDHVTQHGTVLARWIPALAARTGTEVGQNHGDGDAERFLLFEAVVDLIQRAAADRLLVLVLDDLHWANAGTLQLLHHVISTDMTAPVLIVGTYRDSDLTRGDRLSSFLADLRRQSNVTRIELGGLADDEIESLMAAAAGRELGPREIAFARALRRETEGNPFFAGEMIRHLISTGAIFNDAAGEIPLGRDIAEMGLPGSVREVVARRVDRLGDHAVEVLAAASVIGQRFDLELLDGLVDLSEDTILDTLESATVAVLVSEDDDVAGVFHFVHGLVLHSLYQDLSATRRLRLHRKIAQALEKLIGTDAARPADLATHWVVASRPADIDKAVEYTWAAGDATLEALAVEDAIEWYSQALELHSSRSHSDQAMRCDLLIALGRAQRQAGFTSHRDTLIAAAKLAETLDDTSRLVAAALTITRGGLLFEVEDAARLAVIRRALDAVDDTDIDARVRLLATLASETDQGEVATRRQLATEAIELARTSDDDELLVMALTTPYASDCGPLSHNRRLVDTAHALELARTRHDPVMELNACFTRMHAVAEAGDIEEYTALLAQVTRLVGLIGTTTNRAQLGDRQTALALFTGDTDLAEANAIDNYERAKSTIGNSPFAAYASQIFVVRLVQGRLDEVVDLIGQTIGMYPNLMLARVASAFALDRLGRSAEADTVFRLSPESISTLPPDITYTSSILLVADMIAAREDAELAGLLYGQLAPISHLFSCNGATMSGCLKDALGRLALASGHIEDAVTDFRAAVEANGRARTAYWTAESQLDLALALSARAGEGDAAEASTLRADATESARSHGFDGLVARAKIATDR